MQLRNRLSTAKNRIATKIPDFSTDDEDTDDEDTDDVSFSRTRRALGRVKHGLGVAALCFFTYIGIFIGLQLRLGSKMVNFIFRTVAPALSLAVAYVLARASAAPLKILVRGAIDAALGRTDSRAKTLAFRVLAPLLGMVIAGALLWKAFGYLFLEQLGDELEEDAEEDADDYEYVDDDEEIIDGEASADAAPADD